MPLNVSFKFFLIQRQKGHFSMHNKSKRTQLPILNSIMKKYHRKITELPLIIFFLLDLFLRKKYISL